MRNQPPLSLPPRYLIMVYTVPRRPKKKQRHYYANAHPKELPPYTAKMLIHLYIYTHILSLSLYPPLLYVFPP